MNTLQATARRESTSKSFLKTAGIFSLSIALGSGLWVASSPLATAAAFTPAEMIQKNLPSSTTLANAPKSDVLSAVCKSISQSKKDAPQIVRAAAGARRDLTSDIVTTAVNCVGKDGKGGADCTLIRPVLNEAIAVDNGNAAALTETVARIAPGCIDAPEEGPGTLPGNINPNPGTTGGSGGTQNTCTVCHNNTEIQVPCDNVNGYLHGHPGDTEGACQATPADNL